jgi:RNA polymerase sigma-70 factor (ECF subfamily)
MPADIFAAHRTRLTDVAYRVLGSLADAEDVVQEAWLRWSAADRSDVDNPQAYLVTVTTRLAIDRLRRVRSRRESYPGPWLPEPVSTAPGLVEQVELAETVELALLVVLETLSPLERAAFVLHEAFGLSYAEIGEVIGRTEAATRQLARRARDHVREGRPRYDADRQRRRALTERFLAACVGGSLDELMAMFTEDVQLVSDSGGKARAPLRTISGAEKVGRFLTAINTERGAQRFLDSVGAPTGLPFDVGVVDVNGAPAIVAGVAGRAVVVVSVVPDGDRIATVYLMANPDKLAGVSHPDPAGASQGA